MMKVRINGVIYPSIAEASRQTGFNPSSIRRAIDQGREDTMGVEHRGLRITFEGVTYPSHKALAKAKGWNYGAMMKRLAEGGPIEPRWHKKPTVINGVEYPSRAAASRATGIPSSTIYNRALRNESN